MKKLLIIIAVLFSVESFGQQGVVIKKDTLEVLDFKKIKFIKVGERVFRIESPTLTEEKPEPGLKLDGWFYGGYSRQTLETVPHDFDFLNEMRYADDTVITKTFLRQ